jgi:hypothetical protein
LKRHLFNLLAGISLLLWVATIAMWVRSYWFADAIQLNRPAWREVATYKGRLYLSGSPNNTYSFPMFASEAVTVSSSWSYDLPDYNLIVLRWGGQRGEPSCRWFTRGYGFIGVPLWVVAILTAITPALKIRRRYSRAYVGLCATCGYDLRATPDRCPECGTIPLKPVNK